MSVHVCLYGHRSMFYDGLGYFVVLTGKNHIENYVHHSQILRRLEYSQRDIISDEF